MVSDFCSKRLGVSIRADSASSRTLSAFTGRPAMSGICSFFAEHLLNNRLQMRRCGATEELVTLTKQTKIGLCEQVRVNWKTAPQLVDNKSVGNLPGSR